MKSLIVSIIIFISTFQVCGQTISTLPAATGLDTTDLFLISQYSGGNWSSKKATAKLLRDSLFAALAAGSVTTTQILDGTILSIDISDLTIANSDIAEGVIAESKLAGAFTSTLVRTTGNQTVANNKNFTGTSTMIGLNNNEATSWFRPPIANTNHSNSIWLDATTRTLFLENTDGSAVSDTFPTIKYLRETVTFVTRTGDGETISGDKIITGSNSYPSNDVIQWNPGSQSIDVSQYREVTIWDIGQTTVTVVDFINAVDGQVVTIIIRTNAQDNATIDDGTEISLSGNVDYVMGAGDSLTLYYDSSDDLWYELGRSNR